MTRRTLAAAAATVIAVAGAYPAPVPANPAPAAPQETETFRATAQNLSGVRGGQTSVQITISRWTEPEERDALAQILINDGSNALADALAKEDEVGFIRFPQMQTQFPSVRLRYARGFQDGDKRTIILATDRPIGIVEAVRQPTRTFDKQVTLIQLTLDGDDTGEGVLAVGVEIEVAEGTNNLTITNIGTQPVRLTNVRKSD